MVAKYQKIVVGDVSPLKLVKTRMAKSVLDSGWGMLKGFLAYKCEHAARSFEVTNERYTTVTCSHCGALSGPRGVNGLIVRTHHRRDGELPPRNMLALACSQVDAQCSRQDLWSADAARL
jgi:transposase